MAVIASSIVPQAIHKQFVGFGPGMAEWVTEIPQAEILFYEEAGVITAATGGDTQSLTVTCALPKGYAYAMVECYQAIFCADISEWDAALYAEVTGVDPDYKTMLSMEGKATFRNSAVPAKVYPLEQPLLKIVVPGADGAQFLTFSTNQTAAGAAGTVRMFARFLRYELNQAHYWAVNTPTLVRA